MEFGRVRARGGGRPHADGAAVRWCQLEDVDFAFLTVLCLCIRGTMYHAGIQGGMS